MSTTKIKTETAVIATREEMAELAGDIAALQNELNRLTTAKNIELDIINKRYAEQLGRLDGDIKSKMKLALDWCTRNEASEFRDWRTIDFQRATVQFRRGNWEVQLRSNWKIANVLAALKAFLIPGKPAGTRWVRTAEEVNKELIIQERGTLTDEQWHALGIKIVRGKSDLDAWIRINVDFGVPWGPWGWGCGHDVEDVDRDETEELGLIEPGVRPEPADTRFNERLEASARGLNADLLQQLRSAFGEKVVIEGDTIRWAGKTAQPQKAQKAAKPKKGTSVPANAPGGAESNEETATARLDQALEAAGVKDKLTVTAADMTALREELKELAPAKAEDVIATMHGKQHGTLTKANMQKEVQEFLDLVPPSLVAKLPKLHLEADIFAANGEYRMGARVRVHVKLNHDAEETHRVLFHELMHWVHLEGPKWYRDAIAKHFEARTAGEKLGYLPGYGLQGKQDKWYEVYAGRVYSGYPSGTEVPTRYIEWLTFSPEKMAKMWNDPVTRETLLIVLRILF